MALNFALNDVNLLSEVHPSEVHPSEVHPEVEFEAQPLPEVNTNDGISPLPEINIVPADEARPLPENLEDHGILVDEVSPLWEIDVSPEDEANPRPVDNWAMEDGQQPQVDGNSVIDTIDIELEGIELTPVDPDRGPTEALEAAPLDDELGNVRVRLRESHHDDELGVIRVQEIEELPLEAPPAEPTYKTGFISGRISFLGGSNLFRLPVPLDERIYQAGTGFYVLPSLSPSTSAFLGVDGNLVRYSNFPDVSYNELQFQAGLRQRLSKQAYVQAGWRNQRLYTLSGNPFFNANYAELLLSRRDVFNSRLWLDSYYQLRFSFSDPDEFSRFSQILIASLNYGFTPQTRLSLVYQLFLEDYTAIQRYDTSHQMVAQFSYDLSPNNRLSLFGGARFGRSSAPGVNFEDFIYGVSLNISLPVF